MKELEILMEAIKILKRRVQDGKILIGQDRAIRETIRCMVDICTEIEPGPEPVVKDEK